MLRLGVRGSTAAVGGGVRRVRSTLNCTVRRSLTCAVTPGEPSSDTAVSHCRPPGDGGWQFFTPSSTSQRLLLGCVSYDPSVTTIWDGMASYLRSSSGGNVPAFDYVLFSNYEAQVAALMEGHIDIAWNGPVAHVLAEDCAAERKLAAVQSVGMRDVDRDFPTVALIRKDILDSAGGQKPTPAVFEGKIVATGSSDSPQGHLVPVDWIKFAKKVTCKDIVPHQADLGKHGDTAVGEIMALSSLLKGDADGALLSNMMYQRGLDGVLAESGVNATSLKEEVVLLPDSPPPFDHCSFDALIGELPAEDPSSPALHRELELRREKVDAFARAVLKMDMSDPKQGEVMKTEGIKKSWVGPRVDPGGSVRAALSRQGLAAVSAPGVTGMAGTESRRAFSSSSVASAAANGDRGGQGQSVAVIGAGLAGLQTIRALRAKGFDVTAFDSDIGVGGLWRDNYLSYGVQVPKQLFEFSDLPFDEVPAGDFPTGAQVKDYIERYAKHFDLNGHVQLGTRVISANPSSDGLSWNVTTERVDGSSTEKDVHTFDRLVVASGMYSSDRPAFPTVFEGGGTNSFTGEVLHTCDLRRADQVDGKKVVVIGGGKSAIDVAVASSDAGANKVTLLSRHPHWPTPRKIADLIPFQYVFLSRLGQNLVLGWTGPLPGCSPPHSSLWHSVGRFIMPPIFKIVELLFAAQFRNVTGPTSPFLKSNVVEDFYGYAHVLDYSLRDKIKSGDIDWRIGSVQSVDGDSVVLSDGRRIDADVVACGTGFKKDYSIFDDDTKAKLNIESDGLYLFNHTIPTSVHNIAFVGSELAVISNISGYGLQAAWLAKLWSGEMPNVALDKEAMEREVAALKKWKRSWIPETPSRASLVLLHQTHFHDRLLKDMGLEYKRKSNFISEWLMPYESGDYHGVLTTLEEEGSGAAAST